MGQVCYQEAGWVPLPCKFLNHILQNFVIHEHYRPSRTSRHKVARPPNPAFAPISASGYFSQAAVSSVPSRGLDFRIYFTPGKSANHGGNGSVIVCHHGAGASGLTFACFAKEVSEVGRGEVGVLAFDARRHGMPLLDKFERNLII